MVHGDFMPTEIYYDYKELFNVFQRFHELAIDQHETFEYDLVDIGK